MPKTLRRRSHNSTKRIFKVAPSRSTKRGLARNARVAAVAAVAAVNAAVEEEEEAAAGIAGVVVVVEITSGNPDLALG
jgi:hypothetical protein